MHIKVCIAPKREINVSNTKLNHNDFNIIFTSQQNVFNVKIISTEIFRLINSIHLKVQIQFFNTEIDFYSSEIIKSSGIFSELWHS